MGHSLLLDLIHCLSVAGTPLPTFSASSPAPPSEPAFQALQTRLATRLEDLQLLVQGPARFYRYYLVTGYELAAFQIALDFDFFHLVPAAGDDDGNGAGQQDVALDELARQAGLDLDRTGRVMRMLITQRIFCEPRPGHFAHNAFSVALRRDEDMRAMVHYS
jgi:hypothetical protein